MLPHKNNIEQNFILFIAKGTEGKFLLASLFQPVSKQSLFMSRELKRTWNSWFVSTLLLGGRDNQAAVGGLCITTHPALVRGQLGFK